MPDYKELYLKLFKASEQAVRILIAAQQECEELYINAAEPDSPVIPLSPGIQKTERMKGLSHLKGV